MPNSIIPDGKWDFVTEESVRACLNKAAYGQPLRIYDPKDRERFMIVCPEQIPGTSRIRCNLHPADCYLSTTDFEKGDEPTLQIAPTPIASIEIDSVNSH